MSLADDLDAAVDAVERPFCKVCAILSEMNDTEKAALKRALKSSIGSDPLVRILKRNGYDIGRPSILKHRSEGHA